MGLIASLDIGSEKMVMAVAAEENGECRLAGIKMIALQIEMEPEETEADRKKIN